MAPSSSLLAILWWGAYTVAGIWAQRVVPGVDFLAPGFVLSLQQQNRIPTAWLAVIWVLLQEGMGNIPFGYGVAWYALLASFYIVGRWLFEARSILFMCLLGMGLGLLHPFLAYSLASLGYLKISLDTAIIEGVLQACLFPIVWIVADYLFPKGLKPDAKHL